MGKLSCIASLCRSLVVVVMLCMPWGSSAFAQKCPTAPIDKEKSYKLYLYFPDKPDSTFQFPKDPHNPDVTPAYPFTAADLGFGIGTTKTAELVDAINAIVADDYCEFDVQVLTTPTNPDMQPAPPPRRTIVAIGSDGQFMRHSDWGHANDIGGLISTDEVKDYARVWAGYYTVCEGGGGPEAVAAGNSTVSWDPHPAIPLARDPSGNMCSNTGALTGPNATLGHWAEAIGGSAAHEAGHTFGLAHQDDNPPSDPCAPTQQGYPPDPGEDQWNQHVMASGCNLTGPDRTVRRHFSNRDYGILAENIGLSIETMHTWELVNPNAEAAERLDIDVLSPLPALNIAWNYAGPESPWLSPSVTPSGTAMFRGETYYKYRITWSVGNQAWFDAASQHFFGIVQGGQAFHVGTTFVGTNVNQPHPVMIQNVTLQQCHEVGPGNTQCSPLALSPPLPSYDAGTVDAANHQFLMEFLAPASAPGLRMIGAKISQLPQMATIDALMDEGRPFTRDGREIQPWVSTECEGGPLGTGLRCLLARLDQKPHVLASYDMGQRSVLDCRQATPPEILAEHDQSGNAPANLHADAIPTCAATYHDPFPSATVFVVATFVDPEAKHYDSTKNSYVVGPVTSKVYYQFAGIRHLEQLGISQPKPN